MEDPSLSPEPFPLSAPPRESYTRAPCANDGCLFTTSMSPFPPPSAVTYPRPAQRSWLSRILFGKPDEPRRPLQHPERERRHASKSQAGASSFDPWAIKHVHEHERLFNEVQPGSKDGASWTTWPPEAWWTNNGSWHLAVDGKGTDTCWESHKS